MAEQARVDAVEGAVVDAVHEPAHDGAHGSDEDRDDDRGDEQADDRVLRSARVRDWLLRRGWCVMEAGSTRLRVIVVEDEAPLARLVGNYLDREGFDVRITGDGDAAIALAREWHPGVVVLDLGLPRRDGVEVCRAVRSFSDCYIIMLTARAQEDDKLVGLSVGADDYLTKPFSPRELVARVQAMLRRPRQVAPMVQPGIATIGPLVIDTMAREVHLDGEPVELTRTEFDVLAALASCPRMAFSRRQLIDEAWGPGWVSDDHLVDVHIAHIRRKLRDDPSDPAFIRTVRGVGYRIGPGR